jgi:uncharacterized membrane-anchored protein
MLMALAALPTHAETDTLSAEVERAWQAVNRAAQPGPVTIRLRDQATIKLRENEVFVPQPVADQLMIALGNSADPGRIGLILPAAENPGEWIVVVRYEHSGYIRDDDAKNWHVDELFDSLKAGTEEQNKERVRRGIPELVLMGWIERPHYDEAARQLVWSMGVRTKKSAGADPSEPQGINYNTYALGREGYISLNLLTDSATVDVDKVAVRALLGNLEFNTGKRYADFNSSTDKVAEYGLAALVAGVAAKKLGLLAVLAAFFVKFFKVIIVAGVAVLYAIRKFFTGKGKPDPVPEVAQAPTPAPDKNALSDFGNAFDPPDPPERSFDNPPRV